MLLLYFNVISYNLTLLSFLSYLLENLNYICYQIIVVVFLHFFGADSGLGGKTKFQRVWVWVLVLFCHPNSFWVWIRVLISGVIWAV
jgi:hypothetical protein